MRKKELRIIKYALFKNNKLLKEFNITVKDYQNIEPYFLKHKPEKMLINNLIEFKCTKKMDLSKYLPIKKVRKKKIKDFIERRLIN